MAKYGDEKGKKLGSDAGRQRIAHRRARMAEVIDAKAGDEVEQTGVASAAADLAEQETGKKTSATRKRTK